MQSIKATPLPTRAATRSVAAQASKKVAKAAPAKKETKSNNLTVLAKLADLGILQQVESSGLLSKVEKAGLLSLAEEKKLLTFAAESGALKLVADPSTPSTLTTAGFVLAAIAAAIVYHSPENIAVDIGMAVVASAGIASMVGGSVLGKVQKL